MFGTDSHLLYILLFNPSIPIHDRLLTQLYILAQLLCLYILIHILYILCLVLQCISCKYDHRHCLLCSIGILSCVHICHLIYFPLTGIETSFKTREPKRILQSRGKRRYGSRRGELWKFHFLRCQVRSTPSRIIS